MTWAITAGDARAVLAGWPAGGVQCVVTSPPYYLLRDYGTGRWEGGDPACDHRKVQNMAAAVATSTLGGGKKTTGHLQEGYGAHCGRCGARRVDGQIGLEDSIDAYIANLVTVFRAVRRVLAPTGTLWLNIGDSYSNAGRAGSRGTKRGAGKPGWTDGGALGDKQLLLIPARVALALQADGWILRSDIIWSKPNCLPESVTDRPTKSYEHVFMFSKQTRYFYDAAAIAEPAAPSSGWARSHANRLTPNGYGNGELAQSTRMGDNPDGTRNCRDVWAISTESFEGSHFAVMPTELARRCILAGTSAAGQCAACGAPWARVTERTPQYANVRQDRSQPGHKMGQIDSSAWRPPIVTERGWAPTCRCDAGAPVPQVVADPFTGAGTVGVVALRHGRGFWGAELNPSYVAMASERIVADAPLFNRQEGAA